LPEGSLGVEATGGVVAEALTCGSFVAARPVRLRPGVVHGRSCARLVFVLSHEACGCREVAFELLCDYYEGDLPEPKARQLESHLVECPPCASLVQTYRRTAELSREALRAEMPRECEEALLDFLEQHVPGCSKKSP
jgi:hypothetical protein